VVNISFGTLDLVLCLLFISCLLCEKNSANNLPSLFVTSLIPWFSKNGFKVSFMFLTTIEYDRSSKSSPSFFTDEDIKQSEICCKINSLQECLSDSVGCGSKIHESTKKPPILPKGKL